MNQKFIENMLLAKKYEEEAFLALMPETAQRHLKVIIREAAAMAEELAFDAIEKLAGRNAAGADGKPHQEPQGGRENGSGSIKKIHVE